MMLAKFSHCYYLNLKFTHFGNYRGFGVARTDTFVVLWCVTDFFVIQEISTLDWFLVWRRWTELFWNVISLVLRTFDWAALSLLSRLLLADCCAILGDDLFSSCVFAAYRTLAHIAVENHGENALVKIVASNTITKLGFDSIKETLKSVSKLVLVTVPPKKWICNHRTTTMSKWRVASAWWHYSD